MLGNPGDIIHDGIFTDRSQRVRLWNQAALKALFMPGAVVVSAAFLLAHLSWPMLALPAISFLYYCALAVGMLLAWRFHSSRVFLSLVVIFIAQQAAGLGFSEPRLLAITQVVAVLVPINFVLIALMHERGFTLESIAPIAIFLFLQSLTVTVLLVSAGGRPSALVPVHHVAEPVAFSRYAVFVMVVSALFLVARFLLTRKPVDSALLWSLCSVALAIRSLETVRVSTLYWATSACVLAASIVENSYLLAYHDELTALPSRRAFNAALLRLKHPYTMAVVDIDHFKRFNDTYGHDTGDQVLRLVASNLARVTGGGEAYRCGGEEFTILFPGKMTGEIVDHLERLRETIENSEFRLRGGERRQAPRGPERRNPRARNRARKGDAIRQLVEETSAAALSVTVSIGVASSSDRSDAETVLRAADKALYRAKENGRNRVETAASIRGSSRSKATGIA